MTNNYYKHCKSLHIMLTTHIQRWAWVLIITFYKYEYKYLKKLKTSKYLKVLRHKYTRVQVHFIKVVHEYQRSSICTQNQKSSICTRVPILESCARVHVLEYIYSSTLYILSNLCMSTSTVSYFFSTSFFGSRVLF